ncbi:hypothetical protein EDB92DRAFT_1949009 [Lactarius akahatsu]|uniref:Uncharacterized protein n=1 Tax=Lactarius akahatsu TaxID=416441 RepID=A0AAD4LD88_9AGAM|nr:hypothetical protein EDB92DRAFT_1949009 [Lactarius akahatsu]
MPLRTMTLAYLLLSITLIPLPTSARPVAPFVLTARQNSSILMDRDVIFDIAFVIALFFACLGSFAWLASGGTVGGHPAEFFNRLFAVPIAFFRQLSAFCRSTSVLDVNNVNVAFIPRRGGASYPVATVPQGVRGGGPKRAGVARGSDDHPDSIRPVHAIL